MPRNRVDRRSWFVIAIGGLLTHARGLLAQSKKKRVKRKELMKWIAAARSPDEHLEIAAYFRDEAARYKEEQREHEAMHREYERDPARLPSKYPAMADHCRSLEGYAGLSAQRALAMAEKHEEIARELAGMTMVMGTVKLKIEADDDAVSLVELPMRPNLVADGMPLRSCPKLLARVQHDACSLPCRDAREPAVVQPPRVRGATRNRPMAAGRLDLRCSSGSSWCAEFGMVSRHPASEVRAAD